MTRCRGQCELPRDIVCVQYLRRCWRNGWREGVRDRADGTQDNEIQGDKDHVNKSNIGRDSEVTAYRKTKNNVCAKALVWFLNMVAIGWGHSWRYPLWLDSRWLGGSSKCTVIRDYLQKKIRGGSFSPLNHRIWTRLLFEYISIEYNLHCVRLVGSNTGRPLPEVAEDTQNAIRARKLENN
jgi:hypothetical protein